MLEERCEIKPSRGGSIPTMGLEKPCDFRRWDRCQGRDLWTPSGLIWHITCRSFRISVVTLCLCNELSSAMAWERAGLSQTTGGKKQSPEGDGDVAACLFSMFTQYTTQSTHEQPRNLNLALLCCLSTGADALGSPAEESQVFPSPISVFARSGHLLDWGKNTTTPCLEAFKQPR